MNEQDFHQRLEKIEKHLEFFASSYKHLHNLCIQQTHVKINKELLEPALSKLHEELRRFRDLFSEVNELVKNNSIVGTLSFMAKRIHELELTVHSIKEEGLKKKIHLDLTMDGYEMVKKKPEYGKFNEQSPEECLKELIKELEEREVIIITHRYGLFGNNKKSFNEIGKLVKLSGSRVRTLEWYILRKLRHPSRKNLVDTITHKELKEAIRGEEE